MSYVLQHTAEAIDDKLSLIDKNKNLLPYPYQTEAASDASPLVDYKEALEDIGDGSILTSGSTVGQDIVAIILNTCKLYAGKQYIISLDITNFSDGAALELIPSFELSIVSQEETPIVNHTADSSNNFTEIINLADKTGEFVCDVILFVPTNFDTGLIIKPQIEEAQLDAGNQPILEKTTWVPYMDTIGAYVDKRFNSTNAKIKALGTLSSTETYTVDVSAEEGTEGDKNCWIPDETNGGYYNIIKVAGIKDTDNPIVDVVLSYSIDDNKQVLRAWESITRIKTYEGQIKLFANDEKPTHQFKIQLKVVR